MGKRKERTERSETLISTNPEEEDHQEINEEKEEGEGFFACYLLCSLSPRFKGHTYIGFTVNPQRRIRQHNGEITSGAWKTKKKRPWEMILCIYGFPTNVSALQFEWAWQHPRESLAVRKAAASFKSLGGVANNIKLAYTMLTLPPWQSLKLTVNFFSTKYTKLSAGCPSLPKQMKVQVSPIDELPCYIGGGHISEENEDDDREIEVNEKGEDDGNVREGLKNISVFNSVEYHCGNVETANDLQRWIEDNDLRRPRDSPISGGDCYKPPFLTTDSLLGTLSTTSNPGLDNPGDVEDRDLSGLIEESIPSLDNTGEFEDRYLSGFIEESSRKLGRSTEQLLQPPTDVNNNQPPSNNSLLVSPEVDFRQPRDSLTQEKEEDRVPFCLLDSPMRTPSSSIAGLVNTVDGSDNRDSFGIIEESSSKFEQANKQQLATPMAANNDQPSSTNNFHFSSEVEVINLLTPSSDCMIRSIHKKKRASRACQKNIIDLTKSPIFVQL